MKKTSTFLYTLQFLFPVFFPNIDRIEIPNLISSTNNSYFSQFYNSVILYEYATLPSNSKMSRIVLPASPITVNTASHSNESATINQPTFLQLLQVLCVAVFARGRCLHFAFMSYKSMSTFHNPTSSLLNLI